MGWLVLIFNGALILIVDLNLSLHGLGNGLTMGVRLLKNSDAVDLPCNNPSFVYEENLSVLFFFFLVKYFTQIRINPHIFQQQAAGFLLLLLLLPVK